MQVAVVELWMDGYAAKNKNHYSTSQRKVVVRIGGRPYAVAPPIHRLMVMDLVASLSLRLCRIASIWPIRMQRTRLQMPATNLAINRFIQNRPEASHWQVDEAEDCRLTSPKRQPVFGLPIRWRREVMLWS